MTRVVDGRTIEGRGIAWEAYAALTLGAYREAQGDLVAAARAYRQATEEDPQSPEPWTRVGAVSCRLARARPPTEALEAFAEAERLDPDYAGLWHERAACDLSRRRMPSALFAARRALRLDPDRLETSLLLAELLVATGKTDEAWRLLWALVVRQPDYPPGWLALHALATRRGDDAMARWSARALLDQDGSAEPRFAARRLPPAARGGGSGAARALHSAAPGAAATTAVATGRAQNGRAELERLLRAGAWQQAQRLSHRMGMSAGRLALVALEAGRLDLARAQAALVLAASPEDCDALVAALAAADLDRDTKSFSELLRSHQPEAPTALSEEAVAEMASLLTRRLGPAAAEAWSAATQPREGDGTRPAASATPIATTPLGLP